MHPQIPNLLGPPVGYTDLIDAHLVAKQEAEHAAPLERNPLRPSSAGFCARKLAYDFNEFRGNATYPREVRQPHTMRLLNFGSAVEFNVLRQFGDLKQLQVRYKQQALSFFPVAPDILIEGSIDYVLYSKDGHRGLGDVKSKGDKFSSYHSTKWDEIDEDLKSMSSVQVISPTSYWVDDLPLFLKELKDEFFKDNFIQLNFYAMNPFIQERKIDHAFIYQMNKNNSKHREVRFRPSQVVYDYVKDKFECIAIAVDEHKNPELVPKEFGLGSMRCAFCEKNKLCWPTDNALKDYFATWPDKDWPKDTDRLGNTGADLEQLKALYDQATAVSENRDSIEHDLCTLLETARIRKVRFADKTVYELKYLKSPRPHFELRRSKV